MIVFRFGSDALTRLKENDLVVIDTGLVFKKS